MSKSITSENPGKTGEVAELQIETLSEKTSGEEISTDRAEANEPGIADIAAEEAGGDSSLPAIEPGEAEPSSEGDRLEERKDGVYMIHENGEADTRISDNVFVIGRSRDASGAGHSRILKIIDEDGVSHIHALPRRLLGGNLGRASQEILNLGGMIPKNHCEFFDYLANAKTDNVFRFVDKLGWHDNSYIFPEHNFTKVEELITPGRETIIYQPEHVIPDGFGVAGSVEEWKENVGSLCAGNPYLVFGVGVAFAAAMIDPIGIDGGGFNIEGPSSTGKTTTSEVAASVWGDPKKRLYRWKATTNSLETIAVIHNHSLCTMDEAGQLRREQVGDLAYMLGNGSGKHRMRQDGTAQKTRTWKTLVLSTGEVSISGVAGHRSSALRVGQALRIIDLPIESIDGSGVIQEKHGRPTTGDLIRELKKNSARFYGAPIRAFIGNIQESGLENITPRLREKIADFVREVVGEASDGLGQDERVAERMAVVAACGEMATRMGITGFGRGEVLEAAKYMFRLWKNENMDTRPREVREILDHIRSKIQRFGYSKFIELKHNTSKILGNPRPSANFGYFTRSPDGRQTTHYILREVFEREFCDRYSVKRISAVLKAEGILIPDGDGGYSRNRKDPQNPRRQMRMVTLVNADGGEAEPIVESPVQESQAPVERRSRAKRQGNAERSRISRNQNSGKRKSRKTKVGATPVITEA